MKHALHVSLIRARRYRNRRTADYHPNVSIHDLVVIIIFLLQKIPVIDQESGQDETGRRLAAPFPIHNEGDKDPVIPDSALQSLQQVDLLRPHRFFPAAVIQDILLLPPFCDGYSVFQPQSTPSFPGKQLRVNRESRSVLPDTRPPAGSLRQASDKYWYYGISACAP